MVVGISLLGFWVDLVVLRFCCFEGNCVGLSFVWVLMLLCFFRFGFVLWVFTCYLGLRCIRFIVVSVLC